MTQNPDPTITTSIIAIRRERDLRPHFLEQAEGEAAGQRTALNKPELIIGRGEEADIHLPSQRASRHHALLNRRGVDYVIRDNDSRNGVYLNGVKIESAVLRDGDVLQVADSIFIYHEG